MSFDDFLTTYKITDFAWELFKGVSPTAVALFSIWITNRINKRQKSKEDYSYQIKELQLMASDLVGNLLNAGKDLIDAIQHANDKEMCEKLLDNYSMSNSEMLVRARKMLNYANIRAEIYHCEEMKFTEIFNAIFQYSERLLEIVEEYNKDASNMNKGCFDKLCDEVQVKCIQASVEIEAAIFNYCVQLEKSGTKNKK